MQIGLLCTLFLYDSYGMSYQYWLLAGLYVQLVSQWKELIMHTVEARYNPTVHVHE